MPSRHPTVVVAPRAELADGVEVGPHCVVGSQVRIGRGTRLMGHVTILGRVTLGEENRVSRGVSAAIAGCQLPGAIRSWSSAIGVIREG
jgi:UDP-N-acetylglucosamine acyltransferase